MRILIALLALLWAVPAWADSWLLFGQTGRTVTGLKPGDWASVDETTNSEDAAVISVNGCENFDLFQFDDPDADGTASTITGTLEMCPSTTTSDNGCAPLPGTSTLSGDDAIYGAAAVYVRVEAGGTANDDVRWMIRCSGPAGR